MSMLRGVRLAFAVTLVVALAATSNLTAQAKKSDSVVKVTATATPPDGNGVQTVTIALDHEKGWHTYANPVGNKDLDGTQTTVKLTAKGAVEVVKESYAKGKLEEDKIVGDYYVYEDKVVLTFQVKRAAGDASPLEAALSFQSCNGKSCLLPAAIKVQVK